MAKIRQIERNPNFLKSATELAEKGLPHANIAMMLGISERTYYDWMQYGKKEHEDDLKTSRAKFYKAIQQGKANFVQNNLTIIRASSIENWQAAAWLLERRQPQDFCKTEKTYTSDKPITDEIENLTDDQLAEELKRVTEALHAITAKSAKAKK